MGETGLHIGGVRTDPPGLLLCSLPTFFSMPMNQEGASGQKEGG